MKTKIISFCTLLMLTISCRSVEKMIDQGDFDTALLKSARKISGKQQLKKKYVTAIEEAFQKATQNDLAAVKSRYDSDRASDWYQAIQRIRKIESRQNTVSFLLPIVSSEGYKANFSFVRTDDLLKNAISQFQDLTYRDALDLLETSRQGSKADARKAYQTFARLWEFNGEYLNARRLQQEAEELGITHVAVRIENATYQYIPESILQEILDRNFVNEKWIQYHLEDAIPLADREINLRINRLDIGPERIQERFFVDTREIEDGFDYVLDQNGNVSKDSLGNDIKRPRFKLIKARVVETHQFKSAMLSGRILNKNIVTGRLEEVPFQSEMLFEHFSASFQGDRRALSPESRRFLGILPVPFPDNQQMVVDLVHTLSPILRDKVQKLNLTV